MINQNNPLARKVWECRDKILALAAKHGAYNVRVFGSVARGDAREDSDLDLLVEMEPERSYFEVVDLWQETQDLMGQRVDLVLEDELNPYVAKRIKSEAVPL